MTSSYYDPQITECIDVGLLPFRLRIAAKGRLFHAHEENYFTERFKDGKAIVLINGMFYMGFKTHASLLNALTECLQEGYHASRAVDPYALHCTMNRRHTQEHLETYFKRYGPLHCVTVHETKNGRYAFINFMHGYNALLALVDAEHHTPAGMKVRTRAKVLSAQESYAPKPYSPARTVVSCTA
jgi:hypothetical protein